MSLLLLLGPRPVSGSGSLAVGEPTIAASGLLTFLGSGSLTAPEPTIAASGLLVFAGSGSLVVPVTTIAGAGLLTFAGSGSLALPEPATAATGLLTFVGSASLAISGPTIAAAGSLTFAGSGSLAAAEPTIAGTGVEVFEGGGALSAPEPTIAGAGSQTFAGAGDLVVPSPTLAGSGAETFVGDGSLDLPGPAIAGDGTLVVPNSGGLALPEPTIDGVGSLGFFGSGSLAMPTPTVGGTGSGGAQAAHAGGGRGRRIRLFPVLRSFERRERPEPKREPEPPRAVRGRGALQLVTPSVDGVARHTPRPVRGSGSLAVERPSVRGDGTSGPRAIAGAGRLRAPVPIADGAASQRFRADGLLPFPTPEIAGVGHAPFAQIRVVEGLQEAERTEPARDLEQVAADFRRALLRSERSAATELVRAYGDAWGAIRADLALLLRRIADARARGEPIGTSWLFQAQRLRALQASVEAQIARFARYAEDSISKQQSQAIYAAQHNAETLLGASLGPPPPGVTVTFASAPTVALQHLVGFLQDGAPLYTLLDTLGPDAAGRVKTALTSGLVRGQNPRAIAAVIRKDLGGNLVRALTIARTETLRAYRTASLATYAANRDVVEGWIWHAQLDLRTCAFCWAQHGKEHPLSEPFASHPNCLVAGAVVTGARVRGSTTRRYVGEVVEIETVGGHRLTVTPNHPILTPQGWVAAGLLHEGSDVISSPNPEGLAASVDPHNHHGPALIEDVAESLRGASSVATAAVPVSPEDFHGDGKGSQVCVVRSDGLLRRGLDATLGEPGFHEHFGRRYAVLPLLARGGSTAEALQGITVTSASDVGGLGETASLLRATAGSEDSVRFEAAPTGHAGGFEESSDGAPSDPQAIRELLLRLAGHVAADRVFRISRRPFAGHVYNLETSTGWYIANSILTHNCRCAPIPKTKSWAALGFSHVPETRKPIETGPEAFAKLPETAQLAILGPGKFAAYQDGTLDLEDLVGFRHDPVWGPVGFERSLRDVLAHSAHQGVAA